MDRHRIKLTFSLQQVIDGEPVNVDTSKWEDETPEGFANFVLANIPDWKQLIVEKHKKVIDERTQKSVSTKKSTLNIVRLDSGELQMVKVGGDMHKNGKIPQNIRSFFGEPRQK